MNELALFAGAGGGILGSLECGHTIVCAVEIEPYCISVLLQRQNDGLLPLFPVWDDIRTFDGGPWRGLVDVVSGGFPCQRFSTATRGRKTAEDLWPEMRRIISEVGPSWIFAENVQQQPIVKAGKDLVDMGYIAKILPLSAADLGGDHIRQRFWLCAHTNDQSKLRSPINAEMAELPEFCKSIWEANPNEFRVSNGMAHRVDRLKALGNGQVPQCAAEAWRILTNI